MREEHGDITLQDIGEIVREGVLAFTDCTPDAATMEAMYEHVQKALKDAFTEDLTVSNLSIDRTGNIAIDISFTVDLEAEYNEVDDD